MHIAPSDLVDFGGQKSFDMTHQLFIQQKGTFILMFDGRKGLYSELDEYPQGNVTAVYCRYERIWSTDDNKEKPFEVNKTNKEFALSERRVEDFLLVQHSIGKLLYFDEPLLRDFIIIQPTAMVNILRSFITDRMFWPKEEYLRYILENLSSTGVLKKVDLFTLWSQPAFCDIMKDERTKEYILQVLLHLDILVEPKRYTEKDTGADLFLVPCMATETIPANIKKNATDDKTICIAYHLKETVIPSALAFKLIGASINIWPLKVVDTVFVFISKQQY
ncbi:unnamed protein product [Mytilus edulis]|uniref:Uncharacterized protein n=1 Tax=Mytilus edulis TaxID=6550 RepID=A0A8S3UEI9_MYTED|nr:unnamed protein product [Mytilus edulis]